MGKSISEPLDVGPNSLLKPLSLSLHLTVCETGTATGPTSGRWVSTECGAPQSPPRTVSTECQLFSVIAEGSGRRRRARVCVGGDGQQ